MFKTSPNQLRDTVTTTAGLLLLSACSGAELIARDGLADANRENLEHSNPAQALTEKQSDWVLPQAPEMIEESEYQLVWSDEFIRDGRPNPKKWTYEDGFVRNQEDQWYQRENAFCKDGKLYITGRRESKAPPEHAKGSTDPKETKPIKYTSSSLTTKGLHSWTMGRFVMRAKIPHGKGMWPAFWTVGVNGEWPSSGEIDVMEYYQGKLLANVASGTTMRWKPKWNSKAIKTKDLGGDEWLVKFHIWRMDWDTDSIRLYVDDKLLNEVKIADASNASLKWGPENPFHHPHYIIVNLAMGGKNGGDMENAKLPAQYIIDYIRIYQRDENRSFKREDD